MTGEAKYRGVTGVLGEPKSGGVKRVPEVTLTSAPGGAGRLERLLSCFMSIPLFFDGLSRLVLVPETKKAREALASRAFGTRWNACVSYKRP